MGRSENTVEFTTKRLNSTEGIKKVNNSKHDYSRATTNPPYLHGDEETATFNGGKFSNFELRKSPLFGVTSVKLIFQYVCRIDLQLKWRSLSTFRTLSVKLLR